MESRSRKRSIEEEEEEEPSPDKRNQTRSSSSPMQMELSTSTSIPTTDAPSTLGAFSPRSEAGEHSDSADYYSCSSPSDEPSSDYYSCSSPSDEPSSDYYSCSSPSNEPNESDRNSDDERNESPSDARRNSDFRDSLEMIFPGLMAENAEPSILLAGLTELCELLSFHPEPSMSDSELESLVPVLVALVDYETSPDIMLLAVRAITYLCDALPELSMVLVRNGAVLAICARLRAIEYVDVAEQCVQALVMISSENPLECLEAGAIMAILNYIDFFSPSIQRTALGAVANICEKIHSGCPSQFMDAVPVLCNLLLYQDQELVENGATCFIRMVKRVSVCSEMLDELCKHGLIHRVTHLIDLNSGTALSQSICNDLIKLLRRLASGSVAAVRTLAELNICKTLKHVLSSNVLSHSAYSHTCGDLHSIQLLEVLKLLNELLSPLPSGNDYNQFASDKGTVIMNHPGLLLQLGTDILPVLFKVASGADIHVSYCCLSVIYKLVFLSSRSDMLFHLLDNTKISSFLADMFAQKDPHVPMLALRIVEIFLRDLPISLNALVKEGAVYAIDAILKPEASSGANISSASNHKLGATIVHRCLCYTKNMELPPTSEKGSCKAEEDSLYILAGHIKTLYFATVPQNGEIGLTKIIQKFRSLCQELSDMVTMFTNYEICDEREEQLSQILGQIMVELNGDRSMSTFEFVESGVTNSLLNYLLNGQLQKGKLDHHGLSNNFNAALKRFEMLAKCSLPLASQHWESMPLAALIQKLLTSLSSLESFPVILNNTSKIRKTYATIPSGRDTTSPCFMIYFVKEEEEKTLGEYGGDIVTVEPFSSLDAIERFLWPKISNNYVEYHSDSTDQSIIHSKDTPLPSPLDAQSAQVKDQDFMVKTGNLPSGLDDMQDSAKSNSNLLPEEHMTLERKDSASTSNFAPTSKDYMEGVVFNTSYSNEEAQKLIFCLDGIQLNPSLSLYQSITQLQMKAEYDVIEGPRLWNNIYKITYRRNVEPKSEDFHHESQVAIGRSYHEQLLLNGLDFSSMLVSDFPRDFEKANPATCEILFLLKLLQTLNRNAFRLMFHERLKAFAGGKSFNFDDLMFAICTVPQTEFVSFRLTEKLQQHMKDPLAVSIGCMPSWCGQLMSVVPFLFSFETRCQYFHMTAYSSSQVQQHPGPESMNNSSNAPYHRQSHASSLPREKFLVCRGSILDSASLIFDRHACTVTVLEVEFDGEVGTGLGPTTEFYTLISQEFQKVGLGLWREDHSFSTSGKGDFGSVVASHGLFPRPWSAASSTSDGMQFSEVIKMYNLLGKVVAKAFLDRRVLDLPLAKAFYKVILEKELDLYDIQSFDLGLGRTLLEFQAIAASTRNLDSASVKDTASTHGLCFRDTRIEDLCLDFCLPGYPDYELAFGHGHEMVTLTNLEEYVSLMAEATVNSGISRQVEAFKSGFNQVFPIKRLQIFTEEELEHLLCGELNAWASNELLDHLKFNHGYTANSPAIINFLEIIQEFDYSQLRAFLQFLTGAPSLPSGGLAALNPKFTIVRKHCGDLADSELPSVMTCANYLKLPPYSSKEIMKEKLLFAISEGQGSFHLS